jgi:hypothetical protein
MKYVCLQCEVLKTKLKTFQISPEKGMVLTQVLADLLLVPIGVNFSS